MKREVKMILTAGRHVHCAFRFAQVKSGYIQRLGLIRHDSTIEI